MRIRRLLLLFALAAAVAAVAVPSAGALTFPDEICPVAQGTVIKICPPGEVSKPYSMQIKGREGTGCVPYVRFKSVGSLPPGLTLSTDGLIGGTPTQAGEWTFWIEMQDIPSWEGGVFWCGDDKSTEKQFSVTVNPGISIVQNALNPKVTFLNKPYSFQLSASGVSSAQTWSVKSGALPSGMTIGSNGVVSGTPTAAGDFTFVIQVSDGGRSTSATYTLTVVEELKITQAKPPAAEVGQPFAMEPKATGGRPALSWSVAEGGSLPAGLTLDPATGAISGKPTLAGSYPLKLTVTDQLGLTQSVDVTVGVAAKLSTVKKALPAVTIGKLYKARLTARGGATPLKWRILGGLPGFLPTGIKFNAKTGEFSGVAKGKTGLYRLRMQVTDKLGVKASLPVVLKVVA
jgi:putative Ig domain-containing protein